MKKDDKITFICSRCKEKDWCWGSCRDAYYNDKEGFICLNCKKKERRKEEEKFKKENYCKPTEHNFVAVEYGGDSYYMGFCSKCGKKI